MGYEPKALLGTSCFAMVHPESLADALEKFALPSVTLIFRFLHKDGTWFWFETTGRKFTASNGEEREVLVSRDITGRMESEQRLRQLSQVVEHSPAAVVITNRQGDIEYVNPKFTETSGYTFEEVIGKNPRILKSGEFSPGEYKALWEKITTGGEWRGEFHNKKKNGELYWEAASISGIEDENGKITHFVALKEDITQRKRMEDAQRESEALFRAVSEASPLGIIVLDEKGDTIYANEAQRKICGRTLGEVARQGWRNMIHPMDRERVVREWEEIRKSGKTFRSERRYVRKDGKFIWASVTAAPILHKDSAETAAVVRGYVGIVEDITERKRLDEQALRTQRMESIGTLASGVAHDLNNILSPIMMSVELLREDMPPDARDRILTTVSECVARGADIVGQVLTFARGSQGERSVLQLRHLVKEVEKIARETFPKSITIADHTPRDLWPVNGDSSQLHQVLMNLCINARDAMPAGGILTITGENIRVDEVHAQILSDAKPGNYTLLKIMDTGGGIPQDIIDKIFDPFFTTKEVGKGTGLGLSTVTGIVRSHGGIVTVYSEIGRGTTFKLYLPATINAETDGAQKARPAIPGGSGETILIVDDEAAILTITATILKKNGYNVITAFNGVEAIPLFVRHAAAIKVVLTDVMMPLMDGVNLIRALKRMNPSLKIISTTGQAEELREAELKTLGVKVFLKKPCDTEKLLTLVHELIHDE
jgi:nitrogen fixation negative regulator NifL